MLWSRSRLFLIWEREGFARWRGCPSLRDNPAKGGAPGKRQVRCGEGTALVEKRISPLRCSR
jgi:hypothetical protein